MLFAGIGLVSLNNFNGSQKINGTKNELISSLKLARNYAATMQLPEGVSKTNNVLNYVQVDINANGHIAAVAMDVGTSYFSKDVSPDGVNVVINPPSATIKFASYKGSSIGGDPSVMGGAIDVIISSTEGVGDTEVIHINSSGLINEN